MTDKKVTLKLVEITEDHWVLWFEGKIYRFSRTNTLVQIFEYEIKVIDLEDHSIKCFPVCFNSTYRGVIKCWFDDKAIGCQLMEPEYNYDWELEL